MPKYVPSKQEIQREILRCGNDSVYFFKNYVKIVHPKKGLVPFLLYPFQEDTLRKFESERFNVVLKSRQMGLSTLSSAYVAWFMLFQKNKNILVMATKLQVAINLVSKVRTVFKHLPSWLLENTSQIKIENKQSIELTNDSRLIASTKSIDAGRSEALSLLVIDECAHIDGFDEIWTSIAPTITLGGSCIALSSPNGAQGWFYKYYSDAEAGKNDFCPTKLHWRLHPERDDAWFEKETRNMSDRQISQEFSCEFLASGATLISGKDLKRIENHEVMEPIERTAFDRNLWIWEHYVQDREYLISADVARGDGEDYSVFHVINLNSMEIAAEYQGKVTPDLFADFLAEAGRMYGGCMIVVENNNLGWMVVTRLKETIGYRNLYHEMKGTHEYVEPIKASMNDRAIPGFCTAPNGLGQRGHVLGKLEEFIRNEQITIRSIRLLNELKTFIYKESGKAEAAKGYNDDLVMALAIACWIKETALIQNVRDIAYTKALLGAIYVSQSTINTKIPGQIGYADNSPREERMKREKERRGQIDVSKNEAMPYGGYPFGIFIG